MLLILIKILYTLLNGAIALYDFSFYRIPNIFLGLLLVLYAIYAPFYLGMDAILSSLIIFAVMTVLGFALFSFKFIAAGDAKYIAVASLWVGLNGILSFILIFSLAGGFLGLLYLFVPDFIARFSDWMWKHIQKVERKWPRFENVWIGSGTGAEKGKRANIGSRMIPYGVAIATGAIVMGLCTPLLQS